MAYTNGYACFSDVKRVIGGVVVRELHRPIHTGAPAGVSN